MIRQVIGAGGDASRLKSPRIPLELIDHIITEVWKSTTDPCERQELYATLTQVHPLMENIIDRVAVRNVIFGSFDTDASSDRVLYTDILWKIDNARRAQAGSESSNAQSLSITAAQIFRMSHIRVDVELLECKDCRDVIRDSREPYHILQAVSSVTITEPGRTCLGSYAALCMLVGSPHLTHLHLDCQWPFHGERNVVFPTVVFLRVRTSGWNQTLGAGFRMGETFPSIVELQLDAPLILKYLVLPATLERLAISAPPTMRPFCSIQGYNVATGLRGWLEPRSEDQQSGRRGNLKEKKMRLKEIAVLTGADYPVGWKVAQEACESGGVRLVKEDFFEPC